MQSHCAAIAKFDLTHCVEFVSCLIFDGDRTLFLTFQSSRQKKWCAYYFSPTKGPCLAD